MPVATRSASPARKATTSPPTSPSQESLSVTSFLATFVRTDNEAQRVRLRRALDSADLAVTSLALLAPSALLRLPVDLLPLSLGDRLVLAAALRRARRKGAFDQDVISGGGGEEWSDHGDGEYQPFDTESEDPLSAIRHAFPRVAPSLAALVKRGTDRRWFTVHGVEAWFRVLAAAIFAIAAAFVMSYVVVLVTARVPDPAKFPPLPDIVLDTLPPIAGAFAAAEYIGVVLTAIFVSLVLFHKHRAVILRRYFIILGTLFGMRSITMLVTSLSVPDAAQDRGQVERLRAIAQGDEWTTLLFSVFTGMGLSISGVQSMGDYCFSGHATTLTLTTEFICRYSRRSWEGLRVISWVLCISAFICILAARAHYTLDVIIAFYLTQRLFSHYHSLCALEPNKRGANTTFGVFPLWRFLEADCVGDPPADYEWPPFVKVLLVLLGLL